MKKMFLKIKGLWNGWIDFAPKFFLAVLAFALLTVFIQLSQSVSKAGNFSNGSVANVGCGNGTPGQLTRAAMVVHNFSSQEEFDRYFNGSDEDVKRLVGMAPGDNGQGGGCDINGNHCVQARNNGCVADKNGWCEAQADMEACSVGQLDCLGGADGGAIWFYSSGCNVPKKTHLICENNACKKVDGEGPNQGGCTSEGASCGVTKEPKVVCDSLVLDKLDGGQFRIKATVSGHGVDGGKIVKYGYDFDGNGTIDSTTNAPDNAKKHDYPGYGTYTVKGFVIGEDGKAVGGSGSCQKNITIQQQPSVTCDGLVLEKLSSEAPFRVKATVTGHGSNGGSITKYRYDFGDGTGILETVAPDNAKKHDYPGAGTWTVKGYVVGNNGQIVGGSASCQANITIQNQPNNYCGPNNTCIQCVPGTAGYDQCKNKPSCSTNAQCQPNVNYYCGSNNTCDACIPGTAGYDQCKNKPSCSTNAQCQVEPNYYCAPNYTCTACVPGTAGYDQCKNKPSCSTNAQCQPNVNYYCDASYACSACVPGTAGYDQCKNKPSCSTNAQCQVQPNYFCDENKACSQCVPGSANYNECKNKPSCTSSDQCKTTQKFTCQNNACEVCTGGDCLDKPSCSTQDECKQSYYSCTENNTCQKFYGTGTSTCNPGSTDCQVHNECDGYSCKQVRGAYRGGALCSNDDQCKPVVNQNTYCDWLFVDPQTGNAALTVNAQISGHTVNGGSISQYRFNFGDGSGDVVQSGDKLSHTFTQNGTYVVSGHVIDNRGVQAGGSGACQKVVQVVVPGVTPPPPSGKGGVPSTGAETLLLPLFSLLGTFGWAVRRIKGN